MQERFFATLLTLPNSKPTGSKTEVAVRCPYCEDSIKSNQPHFYIGLRDNRIFCHCKKCPTAGLVTADTLTRLGVHDISIVEYIKEINKPSGIVRINGGTSKKDDLINNTILNYPSVIPSRDEKKIQYISERTNIDFSKKDNIKSYKVILNLLEFLSLNGIMPIGNPDYLQELNSNFVGFMTQNKNTISLRNVGSTRINERYQVYKIDKSKRTPSIYVPPCDIDPLTIRPKIILSEGAFDIICVKQQFYPRDGVEAIFGAALAKSMYKIALMHLVKLSGFAGADVHIYSDVDNRKKGYEPILLELKDKTFKDLIKNFDIQVFFNNDPMQKDFGYISNQWDIKRFSLR